MPPLLIVAAAVFVVALAFGGLGSYVAAEKRRAPSEGFVIGLLFGPLGVLVLALLRDGDHAPAPRPSPLRDDEPPDRIPWLVEAENRARRN